MPTGLQRLHARDADHDRAEDQRRDRHLDELDEAVAERLELRRVVRARRCRARRRARSRRARGSTASYRTAASCRPHASHATIGRVVNARSIAPRCRQRQRIAFFIGVLIALALPKRVDCGYPGGRLQDDRRRPHVRAVRGRAARLLPDRVRRRPRRRLRVQLRRRLPLVQRRDRENACDRIAFERECGLTISSYVRPADKRSGSVRLAPLRRGGESGNATACTPTSRTFTLPGDYRHGATAPAGQNVGSRAVRPHARGPHVRQGWVEAPFAFAIAASLASLQRSRIRYA